MIKIFQKKVSQLNFFITFAINAGFESKNLINYYLRGFLYKL